jgi:hypothetical protein
VERQVRGLANLVLEWFQPLDTSLQHGQLALLVAFEWNQVFVQLALLLAQPYVIGDTAIERAPRQCSLARLVATDENCTRFLERHAGTVLPSKPPQWQMQRQGQECLVSRMRYTAGWIN